MPTRSFTKQCFDTQLHHGDQNDCIKAVVSTRSFTMESDEANLPHCLLAPDNEQDQFVVHCRANEQAPTVNLMNRPTMCLRLGVATMCHGLFEVSFHLTVVVTRKCS